jgi:hypothetical protein
MGANARGRPRPRANVLRAVLLAFVFPLATDADATCTIATYATGIDLGSGVFKIKGYHDDYLYKLEFLDGNDAVASTVGGSGGTPELLTVNTASSLEYITEVRQPAAKGVLVLLEQILHECPGEGLRMQPLQKPSTLCCHSCLPDLLARVNIWPMMTSTPWCAGTLLRIHRCLAGYAGLPRLRYLVPHQFRQRIHSVPVKHEIFGCFRVRAAADIHCQLRPDDHLCRRHNHNYWRRFEKGHHRHRSSAGRLHLLKLLGRNVQEHGWHSG